LEGDEEMGNVSGKGEHRKIVRVHTNKRSLLLLLLLKLSEKLTRSRTNIGMLVARHKCRSLAW
jgi:hypothetical protein